MLYVRFCGGPYLQHEDCELTPIPATVRYWECPPPRCSQFFWYRWAQGDGLGAGDYEPSANRYERLLLKKPITSMFYAGIQAVACQGQPMCGSIHRILLLVLSEPVYVGLSC